MSVASFYPFYRDDISDFPKVTYDIEWVSDFPKVKHMILSGWGVSSRLPLLHQLLAVTHIR